MTSSNKTKIFIDGQHGTTGLQILDRLKDRPDIELLELPMADRKDLGKRAEIARAADIAVLCLPDAAAKELVAALGDADTVGDRRQHGASRRRRLDLRLPRDGQGPSPEAARLQPHLQPGLLSDRRDRASCGRWSMPASCAPNSTPAVFGVSGYTGGGKELIAVHEQPDVEPFGLYGLELTHKHVPEMKKYSHLKHAPLFVPSVGHYAQGMLITRADHARHRGQEGDGQGRARRC